MIWPEIWLPTSTDRFYPDFVAMLQDGRIFVVEYKGADRMDTGDTREKTPDPARRREVMARARHNLEMAVKTWRILGTPEADFKITRRLYDKVELTRAIHEGSHDLIHSHYFRCGSPNIKAALEYCRAELYTISGVYDHLPYNPPMIEEGTVLLKHPKKQSTKELEGV